MTAARTSPDGSPRRRWVMRVRDLLSRERHVIVQVQPGPIIALSVAGEVVALSAASAQRLRAVLGDAATRALIDDGVMPARQTDATAEGLRRLADEVAAGRGPRYEQGLRRIEGSGVPIVPVVVHDALCGVREATPRRTTPPTAGCAGCGLGYLVEEALNRARGQVWPESWTAR